MHTPCIPLRRPACILLSVVVLAALALGLFAPAALAAAKEASSSNSLEPYECGDVDRIHTLDKFFLASQPAPNDFEQAKKGGIRTVINLRHPEETDFNEKDIVTTMGMAYHNVPWNGPEELTPEVFEKTRKLLRTAERPILLHCSSANRVGAVWIPFRALDMGVPLEQAVQEAKTIGLKSPAYEEKARQYVRNIRPDTSGAYDDPIGLAVRNDVNVVYQIKTDRWKKDVAAGLHYLDKLAGAYDEMGVFPADRRIVGVFHGDAGYFLLKDPVYRKASGKSGENPNKALVQRLLDAGVKLELCKSTMQSHGWTGEDVLPGVKIVVGAYPRIIDLQLRGYAYIRF